MKEPTFIKFILFARLYACGFKYWGLILCLSIFTRWVFYIQLIDRGTETLRG